MILELIRFLVGSVRLFLTLAVLILGGFVVYQDVWGKANVSGDAYLFLSAVLVQIVAYQIVASQNKSNPDAMKNTSDKIKSLADALKTRLNKQGEK